MINNYEAKLEIETVKCLLKEVYRKMELLERKINNSLMNEFIIRENKKYQDEEKAEFEELERKIKAIRES